MRQEEVRALAIRYLASLQPPLIRERFRENETLRRLIGFQPRSVIRLGDRVAVSRSELFTAARRMLEQGGAERFLSLEGEQVIVSRTERSIYTEIPQAEGEPLKVSFDGLGLLSPAREERLQALETCIHEIGPTGPDFAELQKAAFERELSEGEVGEVLDALWGGVAGLHARLSYLLEDNKAKVWDLVPDSLDYFERFCGPNPGDLAPEEYLTSVLPEYRKNLLRRDFGLGLEICLIGALRDDFCPGEWLEEVSDDKVWEALQACQPQHEPFSLLGALDIALHRMQDERFRTFAEEAVGKLTRTQFLNQDGVDLYQVLPGLAEFVVNCINLLKDGALRAPFWKRMCAWMQATQLNRVLQPFGVDFDSLHRLLKANLDAAGQRTSLLDLRREPIYNASVYSLSSLRCEIMHRLLHLQKRHGLAGRILPNEGDIAEAATRVAEEFGRPLCYFFPGPLEGHRRPEEYGNTLPGEIKAKLFELSADLLLANLVDLSQIFHLDEETRSLFRERISKENLENDGPSLEKQLSNLAHASLVAAAERDRELAQAIAAALLRLSARLQEHGTVSLGLQTLLIAGAAFEDEGAWADWLKEQLSELAGRLPAGKASRSLYAQIQELRKATKLELDIYSRAEAIASAAF